MDFVQWLRDQLDLDAVRAMAAAEEDGPAWHYDGHAVITRREGDLVAVGSQDFMESERGVHIAAHDPARVLREINAKRELLDEFEESLERSKQFRLRAASGDETDAQKLERSTENIRVLVLLKVVKSLAAPYSDRQGYAEAMESYG